jgi:hypothetical protein
VCSISRSTVGLLAAVLVSLGLIAAPATGPAVAQAPKGNGLPEADLTKLINETAKSLQTDTRSAQEFNTKLKRIEADAYLLVILAQAGINGGGDPKLITLREEALKLAEAAKAKNFEAAKKAAEAIANFKAMKPGNPQNAKCELGKVVPIKILMENVNATNRFLIMHNRLSAAAWKAAGKTDAVAADSTKIAALSLAIIEHTPAKDPDPAKGQTRKAWEESARNVHAATLDLIEAAKKKDQTAWKSAFKKMDTACTSCHDIFRVELP